MTLPYPSQEPVSGPATGVNWSDDEGVLKTLGMKGVALAVWQRTLSDRLQTWLDRQPPDQLPVLKTIVAMEDVEKAVWAAAQAAKLPEVDDTNRFAKDVAHLARLLTALIPGETLRIRLKAQAEETLLPFDQPQGRAQLVCCYRGHGLQAGVPEGTEPPTRLTSLPRGDVLLLRGLLWPDRQPPGVVYRPASPEKPGGTSFILTIEPVDDIAGHC
ncbi:MAG: DUF1826 domain-containing protein [Pseudomonadota bacterium]